MKNFIIFGLCILLLISFVNAETDSNILDLNSKIRYVFAYNVSSGQAEELTGNCSMTSIAGITYGDGLIPGYESEYKAMIFDGTDEITTDCALPLTKDYSVVAFFELTDWVSSSAGIFTTVATTSARDGLIYYMNEADGVGLRSYDGNTLEHNTQLGATDYGNKSINYIMTRDMDGDTYLYVNKSTTTNVQTLTYATNDVGINIGNYYADANSPFKGKIQFIYVFDELLNSTQLDLFQTNLQDVIYPFVLTPAYSLDVTLKSPAGNVSQHNISPTFSFTPENSYAHIMNCSLWVNNTAVSTTNNIVNGTFTTIQYTLPKWNYNYTWSVNCTDSVNSTSSGTRYYYPINNPPNSTINITGNIMLGDHTNQRNHPWNVTNLDADGDNINCSLYFNSCGAIAYQDIVYDIAYNQSKDAPYRGAFTMCEGNKTWYYNCTDGITTAKSETWWFVYDETEPLSTWSLIENYTLDFNFSLSVTDLYFSNVTITDTCGGSTFSEESIINVTVEALNCNYGPQTVSVSACDLAGNCENTSDTFVKLAYLNITAEDYSSVAVNGYYIYFNGSLYGNTSTDTLQVIGLSIGSYNVTIEPFDTTVQIKSETVNITDTADALNFILYGSNSISITIYNEETGSQIVTDQNFTYTYSGSDTVVLATGGDHYMENMTAGNYTLKFGGGGTYGIRYYYVTIPSRGHVDLDAYVLSVATDELRNFIITCSGTAIEGALVTCHKSFSGTYKTVAQKYSDATGYAPLYIDPDQEYQFIFYDDTYGTYTTTLTATSTPISINLCSGSSSQPYNWTPIFDYFSYLIYPQSTLLDPGVHNFSLIVSSPDGYMSSFSLSYGNYSGSVTGSPSGGSAYFTMNLTNLTSFTVNYFFNLTTGANYSTSRVYYVDTIEAGNYSLYQVQADYISHFSPYLRYIIATIFALVVMVGSRRYINPLGTSFIGIGVLVVFALIQWISLVYIIPVAAIVSIYAVVDR